MAESTVIRLEISATGAVKVLKDVGEQGEKTGKQLGSSFKQAQSNFQSVVGGLRNVVSALGGVGAALSVVKIVQASDTYKQLEGRLKLVTSSSAELATVQQRLFGIAQETRTGLTGTVDLYSNLARSTKELGIGQTDLAKITRTVNQAIQVSGASAASAQAALVQLGQGFASGTLRGEELNSVMEQTPRVAQAIAQGMGITIGQLRALGQEGKLTGEAVAKALLSQAAAVDKEFAQLPITVGQAFTQLGNSALQAIGGLDKATGISGALASVISGLASSLNSATGASEANSAANLRQAHSLQVLYEAQAQTRGATEQLVDALSSAALTLGGKFVEGINSAWEGTKRFVTVLEGIATLVLDQVLGPLAALAAGIQAAFDFSKPGTALERFNTAVDASFAATAKSSEDAFNRMKDAAGNIDFSNVENGLAGTNDVALSFMPTVAQLAQTTFQARSATDEMGASLLLAADAASRSESETSLLVGTLKDYVAASKEAVTAADKLFADRAKADIKLTDDVAALRLRVALLQEAKEKGLSYKDALDSVKGSTAELTNVEKGRELGKLLAEEQSLTDALQARDAAEKKAISSAESAAKAAERKAAATAKAAAEAQTEIAFLAQVTAGTITLEQAQRKFAASQMAAKNGSLELSTQLVEARKAAEEASKGFERLNAVTEQRIALLGTVATAESAALSNQTSQSQATLGILQAELKVLQSRGGAYTEQLVLVQQIGRVQQELAQQGLQRAQQELTTAKLGVANAELLSAQMRAQIELVKSQGGEITKLTAEYAALEVARKNAWSNVEEAEGKVTEAVSHVKVTAIETGQAIKDLDKVKFDQALLNLSHLRDGLREIAIGFFRGTNELGNVVKNFGIGLGARLVEGIAFGKGKLEDQVLIPNFSSVFGDNGIIGGIIKQGGEWLGSLFGNTFGTTAVDASQVAWSTGWDALSNGSGASAGQGVFGSAVNLGGQWGQAFAISAASAGIAGFLAKLAGGSKNQILGAQLGTFFLGPLGGIFGGFIAGLFDHVPTKGTQIRKAVDKYLTEIGVSFSSQIKRGNYFFEETKALADAMFGGDFLAASQKILTDNVGPNLAKQFKALGAFITADMAIDLGKPVEQTATTYGNLIADNLGLDPKVLQSSIDEVIQKAGISFASLVDKLNSLRSQKEISKPFFDEAIMGAVEIFHRDLPDAINVSRIAMELLAEEGTFALDKFTERVEAATDLYAGIGAAAVEALTSPLTDGEALAAFDTALDDIERDLLTRKFMEDFEPKLFEGIDLSDGLDNLEKGLLRARLKEGREDLQEMLRSAGLLPDELEEAAEAADKLAEATAIAKENLAGFFGGIAGNVLGNFERIKQEQEAARKEIQDKLDAELKRPGGFSVFNVKQLKAELAELDASQLGLGDSIAQDIANGFTEGMQKALIEQATIGPLMAAFQAKMEAAVEAAMSDGIITAQEQADLANLASEAARAGKALGDSLAPALAGIDAAGDKIAAGGKLTAADFKDIEISAEATAGHMEDSADSARDVRNAARETDFELREAGKGGGLSLREAGKDTGLELREAGKNTGFELREAGKDAGISLHEAGKDTALEIREAGKDAGLSLKDAGKDVAFSLKEAGKSMPTSAAAPPIGHAAGGPIHGSGSGDTIPAMLAPGEFVITADKYAKYTDLVNMIHTDSVRHFRLGGAVRGYQMGGAATEFGRGGGGGGGAVLDLKAILDQILDFLGIAADPVAQTRKEFDDLVKQLTDNRKAFEKAGYDVDKYLDQLKKALPGKIKEAVEAANRELITARDQLGQDLQGLQLGGDSPFSNAEKMALLESEIQTAQKRFEAATTSAEKAAAATDLSRLLQQQLQLSPDKLSLDYQQQFVATLERIKNLQKSIQAALDEAYKKAGVDPKAPPAPPPIIPPPIVPPRGREPGAPRPPRGAESVHIEMGGFEISIPKETANPREYGRQIVLGAKDVVRQIAEDFLYTERGQKAVRKAAKER